MKIKDGYMLREVADSYVVVAVGDRTKEFSGMINLNESSAFMWRELEKGTDKEGLLKAVLNRYDVSEKQAANDIDAFLTKITDNGFVER